MDANETQDGCSAPEQPLYGTGVASGAIGAAKGRLTLAERVERQKREAESQVERAQALGELSYLLKKHPDVARILELMENVR